MRMLLDIAAFVNTVHDCPRNHDSFYNDTRVKKI